LYTPKSGMELPSLIEDEEFMASAHLTEDREVSEISRTFSATLPCDDLSFHPTKITTRLF